MDELRQSLADQIDHDGDELVDFLSQFVRARSPNPPGDTRDAAGVLTGFLDATGIDYEIIAPQADMPNIVASFEGGAGPGPHLVLNGHIDVFPVEDASVWARDPWSGDIDGGRVWGRGVIDMKCGTAAVTRTFAYLHDVADRLKGRLTLTCVSDEETVGPWGARWLVENHRDAVLGDCLLSAEATGPHAIYFAERGVFWLTITIKTPGNHGAYGHTTPSASRIGADLIRDLAEIETIEGQLSDNVAAILDRAQASIDVSHGAGASEILNKVTVNVAQVNAGIKNNMIPARCEIVLDLRLPIGLTKADVMPAIETIVARYPEASIDHGEMLDPNWCDPDHPLVPILQRNAEALTGIRPDPIVCLGMTDARLWRYAGIPAFTYGSTTEGTAGIDENVTIDDYLHVVKAHTLSAFDYLTA
ncbi:MAG: M20/M25/M40 family metallo-hydrolase [Pseudomonadota bacterium]